MGISFGLAGLIYVKHKENTDSVIIKSFTSNMKMSQLFYLSSELYVSSKLQYAANLGSDGDAVDYIKNYSHFSGSISNGLKAVELTGKAENDFEYIYTHFKNLPSSLKGDFNTYKESIINHVGFIKTIEGGDISSREIEKWVDGRNKIAAAYKSISLEMDRINTEK